MLKNLLGKDKEKELTAEMREVLHQMEQERTRFETLIRSAQSATEKLPKLSLPIEKAGNDLEALLGRLTDVEQRVTSMTQIADGFQVLGERAEAVTQKQAQADTQIANTLEETQRIRALFEELSKKVDMATDLKERLGSFLEVEKPFQQLRGEAETLRGQVESTSEHMGRLREQHDRQMDAHKLAMSKMEALDRRRDDLGRELQDKERRVVSVEKAVQALDGVQRTVDDVKREIGSLKALADTVVQKAAALEAQREAIDRALSESERLDRAMRQLDAGVRQQQENEKSLSSMQERVAELRSLHESVVERSSEISQLQRETDELTRAAREDLASMTDEMKKTVERFDFESRGLESVNQRVADLRGSLSDFENRYRGLSESSQAVAELRSHTQVVAAHLQSLQDEIGKVDTEVVQLRSIRRDLDESSRKVQSVVGQVARIEEAQPLLIAALRDIEQLNGVHAMVKDALEQVQITHEQIARMRDGQSETRSWLTAVDQMVVELKGQIGDINTLAPTLESLQKQAQRVNEYAAEFESRREFVAELSRNLSELGELGGKLDASVKKLHGRMDSAEQKFADVEKHAEEADRLSLNVSTVSATLREAGRKADEVKKTMAAIVSRVESVEGLDEKTRALKAELDQRQHSLAEAAKDLEKSTDLRQRAAATAKQLDDQLQQLTSALSTADERALQVDELSRQLEDRSANLRAVDKRLADFEERLAKWYMVEQEIARSLEKIISRQSTVEALESDLGRMFTMAEKTATDVREITSSTRQIEQSQKLLTDVMDKLREVRDMTSTLDDRKRQVAKAEERLARADALLVDVNSSLETLQGQKAIVDQAVEKAGSLQFLLKQTETTIEALREEREITARIRSSVAAVRQHDEDDEDGAQAKVA